METLGCSLGEKSKPHQFPGTCADEEPITPIPRGFSLDWLCDDNAVPRDAWEDGLLKLDSSMPFLGATKPKPCATFYPEQEPRRLVWDPRRPLPGLHEHSWDNGHPDRLLLKGPQRFFGENFDPSRSCVAFAWATEHGHWGQCCTHR